MTAAEDQGHLVRRLRSNAQWMQDEHRSPLYTVLMRGAADDIEAGGVVSELFAGVPAPPGSVPQLRLMAALHELVLAGRAPELVGFYPSAGGDRAPAQAWPVARRALRDHADWIAPRLRRTVQTNEPGRAAVLYAVLLWLVDRGAARGRDLRPIRLLELGASAGLNLLADRYRYEQEGSVLGAPDSPVAFAQPWRPPPPIDLRTAADRLAIVHRAGCDSSPRDPADPEDRRRLLSYIWPDESERFHRLQAALEIAAADPPPVAAADALDWLPGALEDRAAGELTVVWHSVVRQYVDRDAWEATRERFRAAARADPDRPVVWVSMEPMPERIFGCAVTVTAAPDLAADVPLARCGDHGPPVAWETTAP